MTRILVIDDHQYAASQIQAGLSTIGIAVELVSQAPDADKLAEPLMGMPKLADPEFLNGFDLVLLDVELTGQFHNFTDPVGGNEHDLTGGSKILPHLRSLAPWLPVIGYTQLLDIEVPGVSKYWTSLLSTFGFDALVPRGYFDFQRRSNSWWLRLVAAARYQRDLAALGIPPGDADQVHVSITPGLTSKLCADGPSVVALAKKVFSYAETVSLAELSPGFSGARVFSAKVQSHVQGTSSVGSWVLKTSPNMAKLWEEARSHQDTFRRGVPFSRTVPLLWPGVVTCDRLGAIAYQLAENTVDGILFWKSHGLTALFERTKELLRDHANGANSDIGVLGRLVIDVPPGSRRTIRAAENIPEWELGRWMNLPTGDKELEKNLSYTKARVHRDLHLRNLLYGERDVVIDFALADNGPLSYDAARLIADIAVNDESGAELKAAASGRKVWLWDRASALGFDSRLNQPHDKLLLDAFFQIALAQLSSYDDVGGETKKGIVGILASARLQ